MTGCNCDDEKDEEMCPEDNVDPPPEQPLPPKEDIPEIPKVESREPLPPETINIPPEEIDPPTPPDFIAPNPQGGSGDLRSLHQAQICHGRMPVVALQEPISGNAIFDHGEIQPHVMKSDNNALVSNPKMNRVKFQIPVFPDPNKVPSDETMTLGLFPIDPPPEGLVLKAIVDGKPLNLPVPMKPEGTWRFKIRPGEKLEWKTIELYTPDESDFSVQFYDFKFYMPPNVKLLIHDTPKGIKDMFKIPDKDTIADYDPTILAFGTSSLTVLRPVIPLQDSDLLRFVDNSLMIEFTGALYYYYNKTECLKFSFYENPGKKLMPYGMKSVFGERDEIQHYGGPGPELISKEYELLRIKAVFAFVYGDYDTESFVITEPGRAHEDLYNGM